MSTKEIFDKVRNHLLNQNKQCFNEEGECVYHNDNGLKCAIGCLINPAYYSIHLEDLPIYNLKVQWAIQNSIGRELTSIEIEMLKDLQIMHDTLSPSKWLNRLKSLEEKYEL